VIRRLSLAGLAVLGFTVTSMVSARAQTAACDQPMPLMEISHETSAPTMTVRLDERKAPLGLTYTHLTIPVKPGALTLVYPQWIPGEHAPTGPLANMAQLRISASGHPLKWSRDQVNMYAFHVNVPPGATQLDADFTVLLNAPDDRTATRNIMIGNWNRYILYPEGIDNANYGAQASLLLPPGWDFASALPVAQHAGDRVDFRPVSLETLVDSPTDSGRFVKHIVTWQHNGGTTYLDLFADQPEDLNVSDDLVAKYKRLTAEAIQLYCGRHWSDYHAELSLSDAIGFEGIEHHQSSDNRAPDDFMTNPDTQFVGGDLIPHEFSHSWNGKYRRPFDLQQPNYNVPEHTELLWVYEGLNQYLGDVLSFRSGIRDPNDFPERIASVYARLAYETGRNTTPIIDVTTAAPYRYVTHGEYPAIRRSAGDFYSEGELLWADVDTIIREQSHGTKSLDDFLHAYAGGVSGPRVVTYTRADIENYLSSVVAYDWHAFFEKYVYSIAPTPPADEIGRAGYRLVYSDTPNTFARNSRGERVDSWYGPGLTIADGTVGDVRDGSPAWNAGFAPGMKIVAVNGREFSADVYARALKAAKDSKEPITVIVRHGAYVDTLQLNYHDGPRYPHLERIPGTPDMFADITRAHAK
jgi:predicted metalloprotease with PDZ domain